MKFDIKEITFCYPKPAHEVELWLCGNGSEQQIMTEFLHTVLKFVPDDEDVDAIVADATYAQYSFDTGIDTYGIYCATKVELFNEESLREDVFGRSFAARPASKGVVWEECRADAIIRTTNNVMHRELGTLGGIEALLDTGAEEFQGARDAVVATVKREMKMLRLRLESIYYGDSERCRKQLADLVEDCDRAGHQSCMESYWRRS